MTRAKHILRRWIPAVCVLALAGCAVTKPQPYDYTAYKQHLPKSILVLPPTNTSPDIKAGTSFFAHATMPLAESGYYVIPVSLVQETLRENGVPTADEAHALPAKKLQEIFGADAVLYITVTDYGAKFKLLDSVTVVDAKARLVDLASGQMLWDGTARFQDNGSRNNQGGALAMLVSAVIKQIANDVSENAHKVAGMTSTMLLSAGRDRGMLWGPRSPNFGTVEIAP